MPVSYVLPNVSFGGSTVERVNTNATQTSIKPHRSYNKWTKQLPRVAATSRQHSFTSTTKRHIRALCLNQNTPCPVLRLSEFDVFNDIY